MTRRTLHYLTIALLLLIIATAWYLTPMLRIATGYAAKHTCSCVFLQGREAEDVAEQDLNFSVLPYVTVDVDRANERVTASLLGIIRRQADFVPTRGCTLRAVDEESFIINYEPARILQDTSRYWPYGSRFPDTLPVGVDTSGLARALDNAMAPLEGGGARGLVVVFNGQIVAERYAPGFTPETPQLGWSMTKSITGTLAGMLMQQGHLELDKPGLFPEWADDERRNITLRHLLHMNSGLGWNEAYGNTSDATTMLYLEPDMAAYAAAQLLVETPGTHWAYSSGTTNIISELIERRWHTADDPGGAADSYLRNSLFRPLGIRSAVIEPDQSGTLVGSSYGWMAPRDWARLGQLYLQDGIWDGRRLLSREWMDFCRQPAPGSADIYGAHLWLKGPETPSAPDDTYMFRGFQDQRLIIIPSRRCVIVRTGLNRDKTADFDALIREVLAALPG